MKIKITVVYKVTIETSQSSYFTTTDLHLLKETHTERQIVPTSMHNDVTHCNRYTR